MQPHLPPARHFSATASHREAVTGHALVPRRDRPWLAWGVADDDRHGYIAIFSLILLPVLALAVATLAADFTELWQRRSRSRDRSCHVGPGVALALSTPLAGRLTLAAMVIGAAVVVAAVTDRYHAGR